MSFRSYCGEGIKGNFSGQVDGMGPKPSTGPNHQFADRVPPPTNVDLFFGIKWLNMFLAAAVILCLGFSNRNHIRGIFYPNRVFLIISHRIHRLFYFALGFPHFCPQSNFIPWSSRLWRRSIITPGWLNQKHQHTRNLLYLLYFPMPGVREIIQVRKFFEHFD